MNASGHDLSKAVLHAIAHLHGWEDLLDGPHHADRDRLERAREGLRSGQVDETAIPSYTHPNVMIRSIFDARGNAVMEWLKAQDPDVVLDAGCGAGILIERVTEETSATVLGADLVPEASRNYLRDGDGSRVFRAGLSDLPVSDGSVDSVVAMDVLEHIDELDGVLKEFERVLSPEGRLVVSGPTENLMYRIGRRIAGFSGDYHATDIYDVERTIAEASFSRLRNRRISIVLPLFSITEYGVDDG